MDKQITIGMAKGYLMKEGLKLLEKIGIHFPENPIESRKLFTFDESGKYKLLKIRPWDVSAYVENGAADIGIVGQDVLLEKSEQVLKLLDLKYGHCKLVIAGEKKWEKKSLCHDLTVATKYPNSTARYFKEKGLKVKLLKLYGAIELAPLTELSDLICDLTATGTTLREHELSIVDTVFSSTALLIANPVSMNFHYNTINTLTENLKAELN